MAIIGAWVVMQLTILKKHGRQVMAVAVVVMMVKASRAIANNKGGFIWDNAARSKCELQNVWRICR